MKSNPEPRAPSPEPRALGPAPRALGSGCRLPAPCALNTVSTTQGHGRCFRTKVLLSSFVVAVVVPPKLRLGLKWEKTVIFLCRWYLTSFGDVKDARKTRETTKDIAAGTKLFAYSTGRGSIYYHFRVKLIIN